MSEGKLQSIIREEFSQAKAREVIALLTMVVFAGFYLIGETESVVMMWIGATNLFTLGWLYFLRRYPGDYPWRRRCIALFDISAVSFTLYLSGEQGALFYFLYLWVIVGNGMRFGPGSLIEVMLMGVVGFSLVLTTTAYWEQYAYIGLSLLSGLVVLPLFYLTLIRRLHSLNQQLDMQLNQAVYAANHDSLTGLHNRESFFRQVENLIELAKQESRDFALIYVDLDGFKSVNDNLGHHCGDEMLVKTAEQLKSLIRKGDVAARLGGDEFAVLFYNVNAQDIQALVQRLLAKLERRLTLNGQEFIVTASVGVSIFPQHGEVSDRLIKSADLAMYQSKRLGKNGYSIASAAA